MVAKFRDIKIAYRHLVMVFVPSPKVGTALVCMFSLICVVIGSRGSYKESCTHARGACTKRTEQTHDMHVKSTKLTHHVQHNKDG